MLSSEFPDRFDFDKYRLPEYEKILDELKKLTKKHGLTPVAKGIPVSGSRTYFGIEGDSLILLGFITMPNQDMDNSEQAWNRIGKPDMINIRRWDGQRDKENGKPIKCIVLQVWKGYNTVIFVPLSELNKIPSFATGDFTVKRDEYGKFYLQTPRGFDRIYLQEGIDKVFEYFSK